MRYTVSIKEVLSKDIIIDANTREEARAIIEEKLRNEEIVLSAEDYSGRIIKVTLYTNAENI